MAGKAASQARAWLPLFIWIKAKGLLEKPAAPAVMCDLAERHLGISASPGQSCNARRKIIVAVIALKGERLPPKRFKSGPRQRPELKAARRERRAQADKPAVSSNRRNAFYATPEWKRARYDALRRYGARCQCCGASPAEGVVLNVDHIQPLKTHWHLRLHPENLQVLCGSCNAGKGNRHSDDWRAMDDEMERAMALDA